MAPVLLFNTLKKRSHTEQYSQQQSASRTGKAHDTGQLRVIRLGRPTEISSTMPFTESKDISPAPEDNKDFDYAKALALLRSNTPEQRLDIQLLYFKLEEAFSATS
ncbi:hypothetical protein V1515DRAFT_582609 [Lipomyces mesembrius]